MSTQPASTTRAIVLITRRLVLTELSEDDALFLHELMNDPDWLAYIGDRGVRTVGHARRYLAEEMLPSYRRHGFGLWRVDRREASGPIGICGLVQRASLPVPDLGFAFLPAWRGQGYAREAASAVVRQARDSHGLDRLLAVCAAGNQASMRLLLGLGMEAIQAPESLEPEVRCFELRLE